MIQKKIICFFLILSMFFVVSCKQERFSLLHSKENVKSIEIVEERFSYIDNAHIQTTILPILDVNLFIEQLNDLKYKSDKISFEKKQFSGNTTLAVKISYENGDTELFSQTTKLIHSMNTNTNQYVSMGHFDGMEFYKFLNSYLSASTETNVPFLHDQSEIVSSNRR